jgi:hypothetical protein
MHRQSKRRNRVFKPIGIEAIGLANPPRRFTQDETFQVAGYTSLRILNIFRNCDIDLGISTLSRVRFDRKHRAI